jgi:hypothetical protein
VLEFWCHEPDLIAVAHEPDVEPAVLVAASESLNRGSAR